MSETETPIMTPSERAHADVNDLLAIVESLGDRVESVELVTSVGDAEIKYVVRVGPAGR